MNRQRRLRYAAAMAVLLATTAMVTTSTIVASARADSPQTAAIGEDATTALARMGKTLSADKFSFRSHTMRAYAGPNGELLHIAHSMTAVVWRPDHLLVDVTGDNGSTQLIYDGKTLVAYAVGQKQYASVPVSGKIDQMLEVAEDRMGVDFPLADLVTDNPEKSVLSGITSGGQVGTATIDGVPCRHFFFNQASDLELELWLEDNEKSLPRRVVVTYRSLPGHPTFVAELSNWDFSIQPTDAQFAFHPPAGAVQVDMTAKAIPMPAAK